MSDSYRVIYHAGDTLDLKTKVSSGRATVTDAGLVIDGSPAITVPVNAIRSARIERLHGLGRTIRVVHEDGTLFVSVVRFAVGGSFALINAIGTGRLAKRLEQVSAEQE